MDANENENIYGVDVCKPDGTVHRIVRYDREWFELDGVRYGLTGNGHGVGKTMTWTAVPVSA
jgi:hypothetical protein